MINKLNLDNVAEDIKENYHLDYIDKFEVKRAQGYLFTSSSLL
jgi:EAL domain-containing protein (putative c-di-GMP-specific phosphodiesterase class I)